MKTIDNEGNELSVEPNGRVILKLSSEKRSRNIGTISNRTLYVERCSFRHLHRKSNSYGFNYHLLKDFKTFGSVVVKVDGSEFYKVPKHVILEKGKIMFFKKTDAGSFEVQIFLNRNDLERFRRDQSELDDDEVSAAFVAELIKQAKEVQP